MASLAVVLGFAPGPCLNRGPTVPASSGAPKTRPCAEGERDPQRRRSTQHLRQPLLPRRRRRSPSRLPSAAAAPPSAPSAPTVPGAPRHVCQRRDRRAETAPPPGPAYSRANRGVRRASEGKPLRSPKRAPKKTIAAPSPASSKSITRIGGSASSTALDGEIGVEKRKRFAESPRRADSPPRACLSRSTAATTLIPRTPRTRCSALLGALYEERAGPTPRLGGRAVGRPLAGDRALQANPPRFSPIS